MYHTQFHSFPDTDPNAVNASLDALRERFGMHAQLEKQRALDLLVARFRSRAWASDVPDVHSRVLALLLGLSRDPLKSNYTAIDAAIALGEDDDAGTGRREGERSVLDFKFQRDDDEDDDDDDDEDDDDDARSASTLSEWSEDERDGIDDDARAAGDLADGPSASRAARDDDEDGLGFSWSDAKPDYDATREDEKEVEWRWDDGGLARRGHGAGARVVQAASRLQPALKLSGVVAGASLAAATTETAAVGAALHALHGLAPARACEDAVVPHLSRAALIGGLKRATDAAEMLDRVLERADAVAVAAAPTPTNDAREGYGPTIRAFAAGLTRCVRELRDELAPLLRRAAGVGEEGAPTLLELRTAAKAIAARARVLDSLATAALPPPARSRRTAHAAAASRCLTALYRAAASHQAEASTDVGGDGFATSLRLFAAAAQPYLSSLSKWLETGELSDPCGELFIAPGPGLGAEVGTEAHWNDAYVVRRKETAMGLTAEAEAPEFLRGVADEMLDAGKSVALLRLTHRSRDDDDGDDDGDGDDPWRPSRTRGSAAPPPPEMARDLCVAFCEEIRAAVEAGAGGGGATPEDVDMPDAVAVKDIDGGGGGDDDDDESVRMLSGASLAPCPSRPEPVPEPDAADAAPPPPPPARAASNGLVPHRGRSSAASETSALVAAGLAGTTTRVRAHAGDVLEWSGAPFEPSRAILAARDLDAWLASSADARSPATCPVGALVERAVIAPALARADDVARALMTRLRGEWGLESCARRLRAVFLGGAGEAASVFSRAVFARLDAHEQRRSDRRARGEDDDEDEDDDDDGGAWADPSELSAALAEAIASDESGDLPAASDVFVDVVDSTTSLTPGTPRRASSRSRGGGGDASSPGAAQLEALAKLKLRVNIPWPLSIVLSRECQEKYNAAGVFLLQIRRARASLDDVTRSGWSPAARRALGGGGGGGKHARQLTAELRHFAHALHEHVASRVLHAASRELSSSIASARSPAEARAAHDAFLDACGRQCLSSPDPTWTLLSGQVKAALAVACDLASARREAARAASVAAADLDPDPSRSVIGRLPAFADTSAATNAAALAGYAPVPEAEAAALASAFRRARSYVLRVVESKLRIGAFPELAELRLRLDFNGFYGTDADATRGE